MNGSCIERCHWLTLKREAARLINMLLRIASLRMAVTNTSIRERLCG